MLRYFTTRTVDSVPVVAYTRPDGSALIVLECSTGPQALREAERLNMQAQQAYASAAAHSARRLVRSLPITAYE